jgi:hypothetical protein
MTGRVLLAAMAALWMSGCTTLRPVMPPVPEALEYRQARAEIQHRQAELAVTGERAAEGSRSIAEGIARLEESVASASPDFGEAEREDWLRQIRELRPAARDHQAETEKLNRQLAGERETTRRQGEIFDEREAAWQRAASEREAENAALRVENKKIAGQRNLYLAILIAVCLGVLGYTALRVLRFLRIIPG